MKYFLIATIITLISAAILIPLGYLERGHMAFGGEWMAVILIAYIAFSVAAKRYGMDKNDY